MAKKPPAITLPGNQMGWLFENAQKHFVEAIERLENEIMRHDHFKDEPFVDSSLGLPGSSVKTRESSIESKKRSIANYRKIIAVCQAARRELLDVSAMDESVSVSFKKAK